MEQVLCVLNFLILHFTIDIFEHEVLFSIKTTLSLFSWLKFLWKYRRFVSHNSRFAVILKYVGLRRALFPDCHRLTTLDVITNGWMTKAGAMCDAWAHHQSKK